MFTRSSSTEPQPLRAVSADVNPARMASQQQPRSRPAEAGPKSVIGNDLKIIGQGLKIISQGTLQVDGEIEGDVGGVEVIIGERGKVTGTVAAERVIVRGTISGVIRGATVRCSRHRTYKAMSITCHLPSSKARCSRVAAGDLPTPRNLDLIWAPSFANCRVGLTSLASTELLDAACTRRS